MSPSTQVPRPTRASEAQLLARLGLTGSASDDQVEAAYDEIAAFLADAPAGLRRWADARLSEADEAYARLRGPRSNGRSDRGDDLGAHALGPDVADEPSATLDDELESRYLDDELDEEEASLTVAAPPAPIRHAPGRPAPGRPAPGRPAPGRNRRLDERRDGARDQHPRAAMLGDALGGGDYYVDQLEARPAGRMKPSERRLVVTRRGDRLALAAGRGPRRLPGLRRIGLAGGVVLAVGAIVLGGYNFGAASVPGLTGTPAPPATGPVVDQAQVTAYMTRLAADGTDIEALKGLANLYFGASDFATAGIWFEKALEVEPDNVSILLGAGAAAYNLGKLDEAETAWKRVVELDPQNAEVHYDLGFLYLAQEPPDLALVEQEWRRVIAIDPDAELAKTVAAHLESLAGLASASPGASTGPGASPKDSQGPQSSTPISSPGSSVAPAASPAAGG